jgi:hypothetical protein
MFSVSLNPVSRELPFAISGGDADIQRVMTISWQNLAIVFATQERSQAVQLKVQRLGELGWGSPFVYVDGSFIATSEAGKVPVLV